MRDHENARRNAKREAAHQLQIRQMQEQMEAMQSWIGAQEQERADRAKQMEIRLSKLSDSEDIEAYLTTCERMMSVYEVPEDQWVFKLAPQLTGKVQQAYAAMGAEEAVDYHRVKEARQCDGVDRRHEAGSLADYFVQARQCDGVDRKHVAGSLTDECDGVDRRHEDGG